MIVAVLALLGFFVALYLSMVKLGYIGSMSCTIGGCERVNSSEWASMFGIPVAVWGLGFYVVTFAVAYLGTLPGWVASKNISLLLVALTGFGVLYSAWLTYLELFVIHAICQYCVVSAIIVTAMFVVSLLDWRACRKWNSPTET